MIHEVIDNLYVGDDDSVAEAAKRGIDAIVAACKEGPDSHRKALGYKTLGAPKDKNYYSYQRGNHLWLNLIDSVNPNFIPEPVIDAALAFIRKHWSDGQRVLVHCNAGHSRGPTTMLMFLRSIGEMPHSFIQSERVFRTLYPQYDPGLGMRQYARSHWASLSSKE